MVISIVNIVGKLTSGLDFFFSLNVVHDYKNRGKSYHSKILLFKNISLLPRLLFGFRVFRSEGKEKERTAVSRSKDMFE